MKTTSPPQPRSRTLDRHLAKQLRSTVPSDVYLRWNSNRALAPLLAATAAGISPAALSRLARLLNQSLPLLHIFGEGREHHRAVNLITRLLGPGPGPRRQIIVRLPEAIRASWAALDRLNRSRALTLLLRAQREGMFHLGNLSRDLESYWSNKSLLTEAELAKAVSKRVLQRM